MTALPWQYPKLVAHRGAGKQAPENTLAAMRLGASLGYRMVEFDVKLSADQVLFLLHDHTLERTTNGHGSAGEKTWHELSLFDAGAWHSAAYAGEPLPTFAAIFQYCQKNDVQMNVEIKPSPGCDSETGRAVALAAKAYWQSNTLAPLLSSFSEQALSAAAAAAPELPRALLFDALPSDWLARCQRLGCVALDANWRTLTPEIIAQAHRHQLAVACYTCNELAEINKLFDWGVDSVITDAVHLVSPHR